MQAEEAVKRGTEAVRNLRKQQLQEGGFFMINEKKLPDNYCYIEYPDNRIDLVKMSFDQKDFVVVKQLSDSETAALRAQYHLY